MKGKNIGKRAVDRLQVMIGVRAAEYRRVWEIIVEKTRTFSLEVVVPYDDDNRLILREGPIIDIEFNTIF